MISPTPEVDPEPVQLPLREHPLTAPGEAPPLDRLFQNWRGAFERVARYLSALRIAPDARERSARQAVERALRAADGPSAVADSLDAAEAILLESWPIDGGAVSPDAHQRFARWRLAVWQLGGVPATSGALPTAPPAPATPPLRRGPMVPEHYRGRRLGQWRATRATHEDAPSPADAALAARRGANPRWRRRGRLRRALLLVLIVLPSIAAGMFMLQILPGHGTPPLEVLLSCFFGALFGWLSIGFWTALFGFGVLLRGGDRFSITRDEPAEPAAIDASVRTAIVVPVYDEPVDRVFAGLRAVRRSLARTGEVGAFDFFVLSDSNAPGHWVDEEEAFDAWRREAPAPGGIFYRHRRVRRKRKSGNIADFCRRFGRSYRYMIVLDADSVMSGESLVRLVGMMERNPEVGVIQTAPSVVRGATLLARIQQFSARLYGPMFAAGMHYWQLGDSPFWGHNAILRVAPFMAHCGLPRLSGKPPLGGDILSHDFVEAALLGRSGWSVWLAFDMAGSYEESPGTLLEEMRRDRRWCQGNLQHLRLLFTGGVYATHRALFLNGVFSYVSALLWLGFLAASTAEALFWALRGPDYFPTERSLFPTWPVWRPDWAASMVAVVAVVLFLPKLLAILLALVRGRAKGFGGVGALLVSVLLETLATALLAPIRMVFYCRFVLTNLAGRAITWQGGADEDETSWRQALRLHGMDSVVASVWAFAVYWLHPEAFWWLTPVAAALVLSVPFSVFTSRRSLGRRTRAARLFLTPEERDPPQEIRELESDLAAADASHATRPDGFVRAVVDPLTNALHASFLRGPRRLAPRIRAARRALTQRAPVLGPAALSLDEKRALLSDAVSLRDLHAAVWRLDDAERAALWGIAPERPVAG